MFDEDKCAFGLFDHEKLIGITAVISITEDKAECIMSFIEPDYRGRGLSALLYEARIEWALKKKHLKILVSGHREGNTASQKALLKHGFTYARTNDETWPDGQKAPGYEYELDLDAQRQTSH